MFKIFVEKRIRKRFKFLKVNFLNLDVNNFDKIIKKKGLFVFPSGPGLANLIKDQNYHKSLINSDYVFLDSGYLVLLLRLLKNIKVQKFSGYKFLKLLFKIKYCTNGVTRPTLLSHV